MGLLDSVIGAAMGGALGRGGLGAGMGGGMQRGSRGGALNSPVVKALMLALAAKAAQEYMHRNRAGGGQAAAPMGSGGLGDLLGGVLGGGGGAAGGLGGLLAGLGGVGGLGALVEQFNRGGHGDAMRSWVDLGPNNPIPPQQLAEALGPDNLAQLEAETGLSQPQLLEELSRELPDAIDHITPNGRLPTADEILRSTH